MGLFSFENKGLTDWKGSVYERHRLFSISANDRTRGKKFILHSSRFWAVRIITKETVRLTLASEKKKDFCLTMEKAMAPHSRTPAWKIPWTGEPGGAAVHGVAKSRTRLSDFTFTFHFMHWRRQWQPTPVFLPGESQGRGSLVGCRLWGRTESDTTEAT